MNGPVAMKWGIFSVAAVGRGFDSFDPEEKRLTVTFHSLLFFHMKISGEFLDPAESRRQNMTEHTKMKYFLK